MNIVKVSNDIPAREILGPYLRLKLNLILLGSVQILSQQVSLKVKVYSNRAPFKNMLSVGLFAWHIFYHLSDVSSIKITYIRI